MTTNNEIIRYDNNLPMASTANCGMNRAIGLDQPRKYIYAH